MEILLTTEFWLSLITLTLLEIILGIDNIIIINILVAKLPNNKRKVVRLIGLSLAMFTRILLLLSLFWLSHLTSNLFTIFSLDISVRDLVLFIGGLFLLYKSIIELIECCNKKESSDVDISSKVKGLVFTIILQIIFIDIVFSLDSVITAIGIANHILVMVLAIIISVIVMMLSVSYIGNIIDKYPTIKVLALAFLILVGLILIAEGLHFHVDKGYLYFAMAFAVFTQFLNIKIFKK